MIVVDVDVLVYFFVRSELTEAAEDLRMREPVWAVPFLWRSEFRNVLSGHMRRRVLSLPQALLLYTAASELVEATEYHVDSRSILELAKDSECSAYDCEYVALAAELDVSLVTMDRKLIRAFPGRAVPLQAR